MQGFVHGRVFEVLFNMGFLKLTLILLGIGSALNSSAQVPRLIFRQSPEIYQTVQFLPELQFSEAWTKKDIEKIVPYQTFTPHMQTNDLMKKIADKSFQQIIDRPQFQNSTLGRFTNQMRDYFKFEINLNSDKKMNPEKVLNAESIVVKESLFSGKKNSNSKLDKSEPNIEHKLQFNYAAFESRAEFKYTGWTEAVLNYELVTSKSEVQIRKNIFTNKQLFLSHVGTKSAEAHSMGVRWGF